MTFTLKGGKDSVIPTNVVEELVIDVIDEGATFRFNDSKTTKKFADKQRKDGVQSVYVERLQKTACSYPGMDQAAVVKHISERIKALEVKNGQ